jgi:hypothetical protein
MNLIQTLFLCIGIVVTSFCYAMDVPQPYIRNTLRLSGERLLEAAGAGNQAEIERLIKAGAPVNYACYIHFDETALMLAAGNGHDACVTQLINAGAGLNYEDSLGVTALTRAGVQGYQTTCVLLVARLLRIPNKKQQKSVCVFLGVLKKKMGFLDRIGLHNLYKERGDLLRVPILDAVCKDNEKNLVQSVAYQKVQKELYSKTQAAEILARFNVK